MSWGILRTHVLLDQFLVGNLSGLNMMKIIRSKRMMRKKYARYSYTISTP